MMNDNRADDGFAWELFRDPVTAALVNQLVGMEPGQRLPSEREQAQQLGVSRTALRDRLRYLESMGILERRTGAGTFVRGLRPETVTESLALGLMASQITLSSLYSVRVALERQAAIEAALAQNPVSTAYMAAAVQRMERTDDGEELYAADVAFHRALFVASDSPALQFIGDALSGVLSRSVRQRQDRIQQLTHDRDHIRLLHREIYEAIAAADPTAAMRAVDEHFSWLDRVLESESSSNDTSV
jgi:GntR family transcriptional repressor for pyruvate dehydrogenase complex